jgi:TolA-binding protein
MRQLRMLALAVVLAVLGQASAYQDKDKDGDKKKDKDPPKLKGFLPANYGKLGLTDVQKQRIYRVQADFKDRIAELQAAIEKLRKEQREKIEAVLTPEQMKRLKEIRSGERK